MHHMHQTLRISGEINSYGHEWTTLLKTFKSQLATKAAYLCLFARKTLPASFVPPSAALGRTGGDLRSEIFQ